MRDDAIGMFWEDAPATRGERSRTARPMPPIPETGWTPPRDFPNLLNAPALSFDTETYDPDLLTKGPGWGRKAGHIIGVSVGTPEGYAWYYPVRHETQTEYNCSPDNVFAWLRDTLATPCPKVGANLVYDVGWLQEERVVVNGPLYDVQYAEALLEENSKTALEVLAQKYVGSGKESPLLYDWLAQWFGGAADGKQRKHMHKAPPSLVGPYAESDASLPFKVLARQWPVLQQRGLLDLFHMEGDLIRLLVAIRRRGVRVDVPYAEQLYDTLGTRVQGLQAQLNHIAGCEVNVDAAASIAQAFDNAGIRYGVTATGKPSFTKEFLEGLDHPLAESIIQVRRVDKLRNTFVKSYILESHVDGRVYGQFHSMRGTEGGTRSGRLSSSTPNLQNIPSRDKELAPLLRRAFLPEDGHRWRRYDYSQIEYRFLVHFACGEGSDEARAMYCNNPDTDYHEYTIGLVRDVTGIELDRKPAKNINFGLIYGMGKKKLIRTLRLGDAVGNKLFGSYHEAVPFAKATMDECSTFANNHGYITTVLGRRSYFELWEPEGYGTDAIALPFDLAVRTYGGNLRRAKTHKALNRRLQGSAAELQKRALWKCWNDGIFDHTGVPLTLVHDEANFSDDQQHPEAFEELQRAFVQAIPLRVPVVVDMEQGASWGQLQG